MKPQVFYEKINNIIGDSTPFEKDCGMLCGAACCMGEGGMYLFPHEKVLSEDFFVRKAISKSWRKTSQ